MIGIGTAVGVGLGVMVGVGVGGGVDVGVGVAVAVDVGVTVGVGEGVCVGVAEGVGVAVGMGCEANWVATTAATVAATSGPWSRTGTAQAARRTAVPMIRKVADRIVDPRSPFYPTCVLLAFVRGLTLQ